MSLIPAFIWIAAKFKTSSTRVVCTLLAEAPPVMDNIEDQSISIGSNYSLDLSKYAHETNNDNITQYNLTCLPDGLTFTQSTGILSGVPTTLGNHNYNIKCNKTNYDTLNASEYFDVGSLLPSSIL